MMCFFTLQSFLVYSTVFKDFAIIVGILTFCIYTHRNFLVKAHASKYKIYSLCYEFHVKREVEQDRNWTWNTREKEIVPRSLVRKTYTKWYDVCIMKENVCILNTYWGII